MKQLFYLVLLTFFSLNLQAAIKGEEVSYAAGDRVLKGYLVYDDADTGKRPGVLVVHEWWGHNAYARKRADMLAEQGYTALAVDMYGDGKQAAHPKDAGTFAGEVRKNMAVAQQRFEAGIKLLQAHPTVDPGKISAIGYCFGGGIVLEMARRGVDLDLVASFHGSLGANERAKPDSLKGRRVLVYNGAADKFIKPGQIEALASEMQAAGAEFTQVNFPGALHAFTNPDADDYAKRFNIPLAYDGAADRDSWMGLIKGLKGVYGR